MIRRAAAILTCLASSAALVGCTATTYDNSRAGYAPPQNYSNYQSPNAQGAQGAPGAPAPYAPNAPPAGQTNQESLVSGRTPVAPARAPIAEPPGTLHPAVVLPGALPSVQGSTLFGNGIAGTFRGLLFALPANTTRLPDFSTMRPVGQILTEAFTISPQDFHTGFPGLLAQSTYFGIQYEGPIVVNGGQYKFQVDSDDGSVLYIDGNKVLTDDGTHPAELVSSGSIALARGTHQLRLDYFQATGPVALGVWISTNGGAFAPLRERN